MNNLKIEDTLKLLGGDLRGIQRFLSSVISMDCMVC